MKLHVPDMSCGHCKASVQDALGRLAPEARVTVDLEARTVEIEGGPETSAVLAALDDIGFPATAA